MLGYPWISCRFAWHPKQCFGRADSQEWFLHTYWLDRLQYLELLNRLRLLDVSVKSLNEHWSSLLINQTKVFCRTDLESTMCLLGWKKYKKYWQNLWLLAHAVTNQDKICFRHSGKDREVLSSFIGSLYVDTCCLNLFIRAVTSKMWPRHLIHSETIVLKLCWFSASKQVGTCHSQCADNIYCLWTDWKDASCVLSLSPMVGVALWMHTGRERERGRGFLKKVQ